MLPAVPLDKGHEIDKDRKPAESQREYDVAFAAFTLPVFLAIAHDQIAGIAGSCSSFSTMSEAKIAVR